MQLKLKPYTSFQKSILSCLRDARTLASRHVTTIHSAAPSALVYMYHRYIPAQ